MFNFNFNPGGFMKRSLIVVAMAGALLSACSNTPKTVAIESPQEMRIPDWYDTPPAPTRDFVYVTGSGDSINFESSRDLARLSAKRMLCDTLNGETNSITKQFQLDSGKRFQQRTTTNTKKVCTDTSIVGFVQDKIQTLKIDGRWQSFVMLKYPLGKNNFLLEEQLSQRSERDAVMLEAQGQIELEREREAKRKREADERRAKQELLAPDTIKKSEPAPEAKPAETKAETVKTTEGELKLLDVENEAYKQKRAEALQKPGAVVGQTTIR